MNLPAHLLSELAGLAEVIEKLLRLSETHQATTQQDVQHTHQKLDEWIQTNHTLTRSHQELLKLITANSGALNQLTTSYNRSVASWQDLQQQPMLSGEALDSLSKQLSSGLSESVNEAVQRSIQQARQSHRPEQTRDPFPAPLQDQQRSELGSSMTQRRQSVQANLRLSVDLVRRATAPLAVLGSLLLAAGSSVGFALAQAQQPTPLYVTEQQEPLTLEEADLLAWATSERGQLAYNLMDWNSGILDSLSCTEEVKRLGVTLKVQGRPATYGFCTVWVVPPDKRRFED